MVCKLVQNTWWKKVRHGSYANYILHTKGVTATPILPYKDIKNCQKNMATLKPSQDQQPSIFNNSYEGLCLSIIFLDISQFFSKKEHQ